MYHIFIDFTPCKDDSNKQVGVGKTLYNIAKQLLLHHRDFVSLIVFDTMFRTCKREEERILQLEAGSLGEDDIAKIKKGDVLLLIDSVYDFGEGGSVFKLIENGLCLIPFLHDIIPVNYPQFSNTSKSFYSWIINVSNIKTGIITNSLFTAGSFLQKFHYHYPMGYIHLGCEKENLQFKPHFLPKGKNVLMVSTVEPRKMYDKTLEQFERIWESRDDINLIIVGKKGWLVDNLWEKICTHSKRDKNLFQFSGLSEEELAFLFKESDLFLFSSEVEGFGLGVIEAGRFGTPLLLRDIPVFREIAGDHATYFENFENLSDIIVEGFEKGFKRSDGMKINSWKDTAEGCLKIIDGIRNKYMERFLSAEKTQ